MYFGWAGPLKIYLYFGWACPLNNFFFVIVLLYIKGQAWIFFTGVLKGSNYSLGVEQYTLKSAGLFSTQRWVHSGQNTCWVKLTQQVGSVHLPNKVSCLVYLTYKIGQFRKPNKGQHRPHCWLFEPNSR